MQIYQVIFNTFPWKQLLLFGGYNLIKHKILWLNFYEKV